MTANENEISSHSAVGMREFTKPRVCMASARRFKKKAWLCGHYEAQDVLTEIDDVDLICLEPSRGYEFKELWQRRLMHRDITGRVVFANPGLHTVRLTRDYDLFVARCQTYKDLLDVNAILGWKDRCRTSVCWIDEMWAALLPEQGHWLHALRQFDHVFVGFSDTVAPLSDAIGRPCRYLPGAVDTLRFTPLAGSLERVIDVYSIGRRWEGIHQAIIEMVQRKGIFYMYDTFVGSQVEPYDHRQHRNHFANLMKRSRYFVVAPGKFDCVEETRGQSEVGHRYFEGAAAGAVMIGQAPNCDAFQKQFPWPDAVIEIRPDGSDVEQVLWQLNSEPTRILDIERRNAAQSLVRHDWMHRWKEIFQIAGVEPGPRMIAREGRLKRLAQSAIDSELDQMTAVPAK